MKTQLLDYSLPKDLIASHPLQNREDSRLLVADPKDLSEKDCFFRDLPQWIDPDSLLIVNNTRVFNARILGKKPTGGRVEIFLVERLEPHNILWNGASYVGETWTALAKSSNALRIGTDIIVDPENFIIRILQERTHTELLRVVLFSPSKMSITECLEKFGHVPLPPYLHRADTPLDRERYQTVFATQRGSIAAPTAGLHMSLHLMNQLRAKNVYIAPITLHVGLGTFLPVETDDLSQHPMHREWFHIPEETAEAVKHCRARNGKVIALGTTAVRALESAADPTHDGLVKSQSGFTSLMISPGYSFRVVDQMITNFHLPKSTLLALVMAFAGTEFTMNTYKHAIQNRYRFYSYGDAMFLRSRRA